VDNGKTIAMRGLPSAALDEFSTASAVEWSGDGKPGFQIEIPAAHVAARAIRHCEAEKMIAAGADPAGFEPNARRPMALGQPGEWIGHIFKKAAANSIYLAVKLAVNREGRPTKCDVLEIRAGKLKPEAVCAALLQKAEYEAASDANGRPVASVTIFELDVERVAFTTRS
jgi:hypothetical protein